MKPWQQFEQFVEALYKTLLPAEYEIERDVKISDSSGAVHQIDVLIRPRARLSGPILVSCKAWNTKVGIDHIREWADIVAESGAAAGVIVAQSGFTDDAIQAAKSVTRRVSLWVPRALTPRDFSADEVSPTGYVSSVSIRGFLNDPRPILETFNLDVEKADGPPEGRGLNFHFSAKTRSQWYLRDAMDNIVGNLWDQFVEQVSTISQSSRLIIQPELPRFLVLDGVRLRLRELSCHIEVRSHRIEVEIDLLKDAMGYENVITREMRIVPLPML